MATTYKWAIKTSSKVDQAAKLLRIYCVLNNMKPSDTSITICAYIMIYGYTDRVKDSIIKAGVLGKESALKNEIYNLKRIGLLEGTGAKIRVSSKITQGVAEPLTEQTLLFVNLDNR